MKNLQRVRTRRQLLRVTAIGAAGFPFLALARKPASAQRITPEPRPAPTPAPRPDQSCFLKGTKICTPSGDRVVQELRIGDEVQTLAGRKTIKWIGYNKFTIYLSPLHCVFFNEALIPGCI
jgi:Hint domain